jgi:hypothetical protein
MNTLFKSLAIASIIGGASLVATPATAQYRHGGGGWHGGGPRVGVYFGGPVFSPFYYPPPVYYPYAYPAPVYVPAPAAPTVYIERGDVPPPLPAVTQAAPPAQPAQPAQGTAAQPPAPDWFFCADSNTYYPYVRECASPWQRVPSQPAASTR